METDALDRNNHPEQTSADDPVQEQNEGLMELSPSELRLMQDITLHQMGEAAPDIQLVLGRVWQRLEQERCRRKAEIAALDRMYFGRS